MMDKWMAPKIRKTLKKNLGIKMDFINYHYEFRTAIFTASITMGSFLLTMKSFIIQVMKTNVYESEEHINRVSARRKEGKNEGYYDGLYRLKCFLVGSIVLSFCNALFQLALAGFKTELTAWICFGMTVVTMIVIVICVYIISYNLNELIKYSNADKIKKFG